MYGFGLITIRTGIFAEGRFMGKVLDEWVYDIQEFLRNKVPYLVMVAVIALVLARILRIFTHRMVRIAESHAAGTVRVSQVKTLAGVIRTTGLAIIGMIVGLQFLAAVGVNLSPLLTSAGIAGVAIGLAAQSLVKDMLNGAMILVEDQFNVGDVITVAGLSGTVEGMSLRKTTIRGADGTRYTVPNSQITTVANQSIDYSVGTVSVSVDFSADPDEVLSILNNVATEVRNLPEFNALFVDEPQILGVDSLKGSQLIFPVIFKTIATKQYGPMREFQRRVRLALEEHHMLPGDPMRVFTSFENDGARGAAVAGAAPPHEQPASKPKDPTTLKPQESNPFSG